MINAHGTGTRNTSLGIAGTVPSTTHGYLRRTSTWMICYLPIYRPNNSKRQQGHCRLRREGCDSAVPQEPLLANSPANGDLPSAALPALFLCGRIHMQLLTSFSSQDTRPFVGRISLVPRLFPKRRLRAFYKYKMLPFHSIKRIYSHNNTERSAKLESGPGP